MTVPRPTELNDGERENEARRILAGFGLALPEAWEGEKEVWHAWHSPSVCYLMTFRIFLERVIEIWTEKPGGELAIRLRAMRPVQGTFEATPAYAERKHAYTRRQRAYAEWNETQGNTQFREAYAIWERIYAEWREADDEWQIVAVETIRSLHDAECHDCTWDWETQEMTFKVGEAHR